MKDLVRETNEAAGKEIAYITSINGHDAIAVKGDPVNKMLSIVYIYPKTTVVIDEKGSSMIEDHVIDVHGRYDIDEVLKVAESIVR
ncbi:MAG: hypothetical protein RMJ59_00295 [Candidatus Nitrosocaldus sp.]|nr:hypothetical protein [Candidatus Nitrosocaldus sp.]MDW8274802.1 hypothetical protein [Candidatus Nitrosocaldus sp.]